MKRLNPYLTAGITENWIDYLLAFQEGGADAVEIGLPFSDPMLDGATIQQASDQALRRGVTIGSLLTELTAARDRIRIPLIAMTYANLVFREQPATSRRGHVSAAPAPLRASLPTTGAATTRDTPRDAGPTTALSRTTPATEAATAPRTRPTTTPSPTTLTTEAATTADARTTAVPDGSGSGPVAPPHGSGRAPAASAGGPEEFCRRLAAAGISGLIVPDVPVDEADRLEAAATSAGIDLVLLAAPVTPPERLAQIGARSRNFVYAVSVMDTTGERDTLAESAAPLATRIKAVTDLPVLIGFGISTPAQAAAAAQSADGVVIGAALMRRVLDGASPDDLRAEVAAFRAALDQLDQEVPAAPAHAEVPGDRR
ncbi:tryptophan synthase subunit alpha [Actinoplanes teichomyceticus]|uniref:tryptophan synthase subunit alpha n=1 Tax=Actinoplanes teichomyceticus TaxID=1867 RepID=UPI0011EB43AB|nr:tryptophan synthase subunit alpha [Actinoplanes teichomyceticus]